MNRDFPQASQKPSPYLSSNVDIEIDEMDMVVFLSQNDPTRDLFGTRSNHSSFSPDSSYRAA